MTTAQNLRSGHHLSDRGYALAGTESLARARTNGDSRGTRVHRGSLTGPYLR